MPPPIVNTKGWKISALKQTLGMQQTGPYVVLTQEEADLLRDFIAQLEREVHEIESNADTTLESIVNSICDLIRMSKRWEYMQDQLMEAYNEELK